VLVISDLWYGQKETRGTGTSCSTGHSGWLQGNSSSLCKRGISGTGPEWWGVPIPGRALTQVDTAHSNLLWLPQARVWP